MSTANRDQAEHRNCEEAGHWITHQARYDRMLEAFAAMLFAQAAVDRGDRVLDVGCGCAATTLDAARSALEGEAVGIDLSAAMLGQARSDALSAGIGNVSFVGGDAQIYAFEPDWFNMVISRFGVMFTPTRSLRSPTCATPLSPVGGWCCPLAADGC
jgi:SAM-dependent methyltransferase